MDADPKNQTNHQQTIRDDGTRRRRIEGEGVLDEAGDVFCQLTGVYDGIPRAVEEDMRHPTVMGSREIQLNPLRGRHRGSQYDVGDTQGRFQV